MPLLSKSELIAVYDAETTEYLLDVLEAITAILEERQKAFDRYDKLKGKNKRPEYTGIRGEDSDHRQYRPDINASQ